MDKKHTLVIGGTMGLGRALVKSWVERDHIISVIGRNFPLVSDENIKNVYYLVLDLLDGNSISKTLANIIDENAWAYEVISHYDFIGFAEGTEPGKVISADIDEAERVGHAFN